MEDIVAVIVNYFKISTEIQIFIYLYFTNKKGEIITLETDINYVLSKQKNGAKLLIYQVAKPDSDEEVAMISYFYSEFYIDSQNRGFPQIMKLKKSIKSK
jgi:cytochrome c